MWPLLPCTRITLSAKYDASPYRIAFRVTGAYVCSNAKFAHFAHFHIIFHFTRNLSELAQTAQRSLEAETLQKVVQGRVDLPLIIASQNELRGFAQSSFKDQISTLRSGRRCGRFCPAPELLFKLSMMLRHTE